jgi:hypothetical protein
VDWDKQPLGELPDQELADRLGVSCATVQSNRNARGLPSYRSRYGTHGIDWDSQPLGKVGDKELARRLGVRYKVVWWQRSKRGIPPKYSQRARPCYLSPSEATLIVHVLQCATAQRVVPAHLVKRPEFAEVYREILKVRDNPHQGHPSVRTTTRKEARTTTISKATAGQVIPIAAAAR